MKTYKIGNYTIILDGDNVSIDSPILSKDYRDTAQGAMLAMLNEIDGLKIALAQRNKSTGWD